MGALMMTWLAILALFTFGGIMVAALRTLLETATIGQKIALWATIALWAWGTGIAITILLIGEYA